MGVNKEVLSNYLHLDPQYDRFGNLKYLVACGSSLFLAGLSHRQISDLDLVVVNGDVDYLLSLTGVDARLPENFWGGLSLTGEFLIKTSMSICFGSEKFVVVHPAITLAQKEISDIGFPREKDRQDVEHILRLLQQEAIFTGWQEIYRSAASYRR